MFDLSASDILIDPYATYNKLRERHRIYEICPGKIWVISRYDDVLHCLNSQNVFTSTDNIKFFSPSWLPDSCKSDFFISCVENPEYNARRSAISSPFASNEAVKLKPFMDQLAATLVNRMIKKKQIDFVEDFSFPYVLEIIMRIAGLECIQDPNDTYRWIKLVELLAVKDKFSEEEKNEIVIAIVTQRKIFNTIIDKHRFENDDTTFLSKLMTSRIRNTELTKKQLINALELIIRSGFQTTAHLLSTAIVELIKNKKMLDSLIASPSRIPNFVEELLRLHSSFPFAMRHTKSDFELEGSEITIQKGEQVLLSLAAANRDPRHFATPDSYILNRVESHIGFGFGSHMCMGLHLARLELCVALSHLIVHIPQMTCPTDARLDWKPTMIFRALEKLPITYTQKLT